MPANRQRISDREQAERQEPIADAVASVRLEGLEPTGGAREIFERYDAGEITVDEMGEEIRALKNVNSDPYLFPGTEVLRNLSGIRDPPDAGRFRGQ